jgi:alkylated DNA repair dioxygenase AlkB
MTELFPELGIYYYSKVVQDDDIMRFMDNLCELDGFTQTPVVVYGRKCLQPRLTMAFSEGATTYKYSGTSCKGLPFTGFMEELKSIVEEVVGVNFNYCLINKYRDGNDSIGAHSDNENGMTGPIASLSFGATRFFDVTSKTNQFSRIRTELVAGSLIVMHPDSQKKSKHAVPVQKKVKDVRYNLTFRNIHDT